jgi:hypothetical protein
MSRRLVASTINVRNLRFEGARLKKWTSNSSWALLSNQVTGLCFEMGIFSNDDDLFVFNDTGDRFIRPAVPFPLVRLTELDYGEHENPFSKPILIVPSIGTSNDVSRLYFGLRTRGFGYDGMQETSRIWSSICNTEGLKQALSFGFNGTYCEQEECWIAFKYVEDQDASNLAKDFVEFVSRLAQNGRQDNSVAEN